MEWQACLSSLQVLEPFPEFLVASGSLPPGVPTDFYAQVARLAKTRRAKLILDTSGAPLKEGLAQGVFLVKPNFNELCALVGRPLDTDEDLVQACRKIVKAGQAEVIALTLGHRGALFISHEAVWRSPAVPIKPVSAVGAGDSFVGGITWSLGEGSPLDSVFRYGMAAGAAALVSPGTELCYPDDVHRLYEKVELIEICKL